MNILISLIIFAVLALSARQIGAFATKFKLPLISGYLFAGILIGPYLLNLITKDSIQHLRIIDEISLGFIAFAAGSELFVADLKSRMRSIGFITTGLVIFTFILGTIAIILLGDYIPFMKEMSITARFAVAIMAGAILVARSPSSAIAIIREMRAHGPFTKTTLGVTVIMDVVVITLFAVTSSVADGLLNGVGFSLSFFIILIIELLLSILTGTIIFALLRFAFNLNIPLVLKSLLVLVSGYSVFLSSNWLKHTTSMQFGVEIFVEPLLVCMTTGFLITNFSQFRLDFTKMIHDTGPLIYVIFFTLTGASLSLDVLVNTWQIAIILFFVRLLGISIGSFLGGTVAGDSVKYNKIAWMAFITQAGVGLGLAKEVAVEFPEMGSSFATVIISVIVMNQLVGPPFFKSAIRKAGEEHLPENPHPDDMRDAVIIGVEPVSLALARRLQEHHWRVILADTDSSYVDNLDIENVESQHISEVDEENLKKLLTPSTDALILLMNDDEKNFRACQTAIEKFGIPRLIVRPHSICCREQFEEIGALVLNPAAAMISMLDQAVRAPESAASILKSDPQHEIVQITISDPDVAGIPLRDLRIPTDILILRITRDDHSLEPHGYTSFQLGDEVTVMGKHESLEMFTDKVGF